MRHTNFQGSINSMTLHQTTSGDLELKIDVRVQHINAVEAQRSLAENGFMQEAVVINVVPKQLDMMKGDYPDAHQAEEIPSEEPTEPLEDDGR